MLDCIAHRGPDGVRQVIRDERVGLGHRRLAIIDLSDDASQPMRSPAGSEVILNGEIYNYVELRAELAAGGATFQTASDTEVLLAAYDRWGTDCLSRLNGMFALAIYDPSRRTLLLARDRFGEKPLYYHRAPDGTFLFASEIKALLAYPGVTARADRQSVYRFLRHKLPELDPTTFFEGIVALPPAHYLELRVDDGREVLARYWGLEGSTQDSRPRSELAAAYGALLQDSIGIRLRADVAVGSSLSGGIDSSAVVGYLALGRHVERQHTFSARFPGWRLDEGRYIADVIALSGAQSHEVEPIPDPSDLERVIWHQDHPFGSLSIYAQWAVMRLAREQGVTVLLDGQGADESLAGYHFYFAALFRYLLRTGRWLALARELRCFSLAHGSAELRSLAFYAMPDAAANRLRSLRSVPGIATSFARDGAARSSGHADTGRFRTDLDQMLARTLTETMLPGLLRYADRNSMAFGREVRLPYLDHRLVELAFTLPWEMKLRRGLTKRVLRESMRDYLPASVRGRTDKVGFAPPQAAWLRGPLREWAEDLLASARFAEREWNDAPVVRARWRAFRDGEDRLGADVWRFLSVEAWARCFLDGRQQGSRVGA
ncbi:MAG: asparagine synthase (glutamine-hydrolyzing) [Chloroflexota bacterium]|nr:asparagine synthase (glutamine-hydrolyzing) [Chloroflexota bacterium]